MVFFGFAFGSGPIMFHSWPENCAGGKLCGVRFANSAWAKVFQMFAGQKPPNPPPPKADRLSVVTTEESCWLTNIPTTIAYCGTAPMKNPDR